LARQPTDRLRTGLHIGPLLESAGSSFLFAWLLVAAWQLSLDPSRTALAVGAWLLLRRAALLALPRLPGVAVHLTGIVLAMAVIGLLLVRGPADLLWQLACVLLVAATGPGLMAAARWRAPSVHPAEDHRASRWGAVVGAAAATPVLLVSPAVGAWIGLAVLVVGWAARGRSPGPSGAQAPDHDPSGAGQQSRSEHADDGPVRAAEKAGQHRFRPLVQPRTSSYLIAAFVTGLLLAALYAWLPQLVGAVAGLNPALTGIALALVAAGALAPLPVIRLRSRLPAVLPVVALVGALSVAAGVTVLLAPWLVGLLVLPAVGALAVSLDAEQLIAARRAEAGSAERMTRVLVALLVGQLAGVLCVLALGTEPVGVGGPLVVLAAVGAFLGLAILGLDRHSLRAMRHQVQQFSWDADPPPRAFEPQPAATRASRLAAWVERQVEIELVDVALPVSGRRYAIARPSGEGRDSLFEQARQDPERQMPYWAKVWPSGVALADVAVERARELRGQQVLELGAGLGVTAIAALEEGARLVTADYALLPLAFCRLNGLLNSGRAPGSICFNWRDDEQVQQVLGRHPPIGLILAADVLYEYRDIQPLKDVIDRLLAPGGSLWLAEPVRRTAQRFLDIVAADGWLIHSRRIRADWPDATDGWVNVHVIRREARPVQDLLALGGWRA